SRIRRRRHGTVTRAPGVGEARWGPALTRIGRRSGTGERGGRLARGLEDRLEAAEQRCALPVEPLARGLVAEAERGAARVEAHGRPEHRRVRLRGLDQEELGPRVLHPQRRETELQEVLAVDAAGLLHDGVEAAVPERRQALLV